MARETLSDEDARQGRTGRPVLVILLTSLFLLLIAVAVYMVWVYTTTPETMEERAAPTLSDEAPVTSPRNPANPASVVPEAGGEPVGGRDTAN